MECNKLPEKWEPFCIREYVAGMRKDPTVGWPFATDFGGRNKTREENKFNFPPMQVKKFTWWRNEIYPVADKTECEVHGDITNHAINQKDGDSPIVEEERPSVIRTRNPKKFMSARAYIAAIRSQILNPSDIARKGMNSPVPEEERPSGVRPRNPKKFMTARAYIAALSSKSH